MNLMRLLKFDTWSIRYKMLAGLALAIGLPLFLFFIMGSRTTPAVLLTHYESSLDFAVRSEAREIEANLNSVLAQIATISQSTEVSSQAVLFARMAAYEQIPISPVLRNSTIDILGASLEGHPAIRAARLLSSDGALLISVGETREFPGLTDNDQQQHPAYEQIMAVEFSQEAPLLLAPYIDPESENLLLEAATLVVSQDTLLGFMVYTLDTEALLVNPLTANMAETGSIQYSYILDADRRLLTPLKGLQPLERRVTLYGGGEPPAAGSVEPYIQNWDGTPVEVLGRHAVIERTGWSVVTEVIVEDVTGPISRTMVLRLLPLAALST
ncbi:MAG: cache domain-containing protein, partial [Anaerolineae bacterium]|nr:cache domain-containing protein [Anaerolineae bacterium]